MDDRQASSPQVQELPAGGDRPRNRLADLTRPVPREVVAPVVRPTGRQRAAQGKAWVAGVDLGEDGTGTIASRPSEVNEAPEWDALLARWGYDPDRFEVAGPVRVSEWEAQAAGGEVKTLFAHRARIIARTVRRIDPAELDDLVRGVKATRRRPPKPTSTDPRGFGVALGDWQVGKGDGDGLEGTVRRLDRMIDQVGERLRWAVKHHGVGVLGVFGLGDLGEGCTGFYPMQDFTVQADRRAQIKVVRRMIRDALREWSGEVPEVLVAAVGGNHGENRKDGKAFTTFADNDDVAVFEMVAEALSENPKAYGHIRWAIPEGELTQTVDLAGLNVGLAHSHTAAKGGSPGDKVPNWWAKQMFAGLPLAPADLLLTGHYHHLIVRQVTRGKDWIQVPAMDGGSVWVEQSMGTVSSPGTVTFTVRPQDPGDPVWWNDLAVLAP